MIEADRRYSANLNGAAQSSDPVREDVGPPEDMPPDGEPFKSFGPDAPPERDALHAGVVGGVQR